MTVGTVPRGHEPPIRRWLDIHVHRPQARGRRGRGRACDRGRRSPDHPATRAAAAASPTAAARRRHRASPRRRHRRPTPRPAVGATPIAPRRGTAVAEGTGSTGDGGGSDGPRPSDSSIQSPPVAARSAAIPSRRRPPPSGVAVHGVGRAAAPPSVRRGTSGRTIAANPPARTRPSARSECSSAGPPTLTVTAPSNDTEPALDPRARTGDPTASGAPGDP